MQSVVLAFGVPPLVYWSVEDTMVEEVLGPWFATEVQGSTGRLIVKLPDLSYRLEGESRHHLYICILKKLRSSSENVEFCDGRLVVSFFEYVE